MCRLALACCDSARPPGKPWELCWSAVISATAASPALRPLLAVASSSSHALWLRPARNVRLLQDALIAPEMLLHSQLLSSCCAHGLIYHTLDGCLEQLHTPLVCSALSLGRKGMSSSFSVSCVVTCTRTAQQNRFCFAAGSLLLLPAGRP